MASQSGTRPKGESSGKGQANEQKSGEQTGVTGAADKESNAGAGGGGIASLKADHRKAEQLFAQFEKAKDDEKQALIEQVCNALTLHTMLEEEIFYPVCREKIPEDDSLNEAQVEHDSAKLLIADLLLLRQDDPFRDAKVKVLAEQIKHHVREEESGKDGIFAKAEAKGLDTPELAQRLKQRRTELEQCDRLPGGEPVAINLQSMNKQREEYEMASYQHGQERDDQGRFTGGGAGGRGRGDYDDDRGSRRGGSAGRDRDEDGRFTSSRGGGSGRGQDDDDRGGRNGRGRDDDDGRGWYGDSRGHSEASRRGWEDRGSSRGSSGRYDDDDDRGGRRGGGDGRGWYGDSRGHSEASRRGWDNPDHGDSGWYGDSRGHSEASRRGWDNPDHGRSGWFGDPEGHSEASRKGWEDRGSSRSSQGRYDDDDDRRGSSRSSRGRDDDDNRGGGRGWSGDSRGHAEAARRGWENRH
ncbi:hemerythrin domain-containing protein [Novosphingobium sp. UBA1939]|uniref:hemerythrin domain-containing protein n=1 Tax=Novosphingobium sp. UBA1939 TaxID=1946982 RepID=UPI0025D16816|nr:hemerythrin domain-containing protein [Novosphingobium sp. UBA1939]